ncbi:FadR/GntR family transcriptional regulator [Pseudonocardia bannensis]|uniref:FadR family transcriptional regulator n=1 Tax=Pseudonocardia bannensis TaxID=630973 RepID=A0A848DER4_9PSEU|nr:FCD domain-containing protein [Pseudonocardia bannensis]NMH91041.1 FadR family transcriptional regulator [Pseudonocardia bannensis]
MAEREQTVGRGALPSHTARRILRDVLQRGLESGDALADESRLIEHYKVSRGTLREALRLLSFLGAITIKSGPHGGPRLATPGPAVVGSAMGMVVQFRGATLRTVFEARTAIEPAVAALAATHRKDVDLERLDESVAALRAAQKVPGPEYAAQSGRFHLRVAEASHNEVLATVVPALGAMTTTVPWRYPRGSRPELTERISTVVEAIRTSDAATASSATASMFEWITEDLQRNQRAKMETRILWPDVDEVLTDQRYD